MKKARRDLSSGERPGRALFTKTQFIHSKTLGLPKDAVSAVLKEDESCTKEDAIKRVNQFLKRKV